jgi:hypothetical protein
MQRSLDLTDKRQKSPPQSFDFWGRAAQRASRDSNQSRDAFVSGAVVAVSPSAMEHVFPCGMFLHCASNADYLYVNLKESLAENAASPLAVGKSLSLRQSGGQLAQGNGRGSRPVTQLWFGIAVAAVLTDSPFGLRESPFPRFPLPPRKPPDSARSHTWCDSDSGSRRQVGTCPISVLEASPASSTS